MPNTRPAARAGQFYPASKKSLRGKIEESFTHQLGPGKVPELDSGERKIKGAIVPHAGYKFSGPVAAHVYGALAEDGYPDTFIILGPKHPDPFMTGPTPAAAITKETFEMPLGKVPVDQNLADRIIEGPVEVDSDMHASEHSIEVQLPFLQYFDPDISFVPICVSSQDIQTGEGIGRSLQKAIQDRDVVIIASTDLTHCGPRYNQLPPGGKNADEFAKEQDERAIDRINKLDPRGLSKVIEDYDITMCGPGGVEAMIFAIREEVEKGTLLKYATSQDVMPGQNAVGYGGIIFE